MPPLDFAAPGRGPTSVYTKVGFEDSSSHRPVVGKLLEITEVSKVHLHKQSFIQRAPYACARDEGVPPVAVAIKSVVLRD
ncbi:hypothetical protein TNCV_4743571 [Trichonephila clavipes]|nr:hypothetical protein TNCV_4743571 [Trichonephila clavipes]